MVIYQKSKRPVDPDGKMSEVYWSDIDVKKFSADINTNIKAVIESIRNILQTSYGERFFNVKFGSTTSGVLFELLDESSASYYRNSIVSSIEEFEPRVDVDEERTKFIIGRDGSTTLSLYFKLRGEPTENIYTYNFQI